MAPPHLSLNTSSRDCSHVRSVSFNLTPQVHVVDHLYWQPGERANGPTLYELNNAKMLTKQALDAATAEEKYEKWLDTSDDAHVTGLVRTRGSLALRTQSTQLSDQTPRVVTMTPVRTPRVVTMTPVCSLTPTPRVLTITPPATPSPPHRTVHLDPSKILKRKPIPKRTITSPEPLPKQTYKSKLHEDFSESFLPGLTRSVTTGSDFDDFLPPEKMLTWEHVVKDEAESRRSKTVAGLTSRGVKMVRSTMSKVKGTTK